MEPHVERPLTAPVHALFVVTIVAGLLVVAAVTAATGSAPPTSSRAAAEASCAPAASVELDRGRPLRTSLVATATEPTWVALHPTMHGVGVLIERAGRVRAIVDSTVTSGVVVDVSADTVADGDGGALVATYDLSGSWLYLAHTTRGGDDLLTAHRVGPDGLPRDEPGRVILRVDHGSSRQHHGGSLAVLPDGTLLLGTGDGGGLGDPRDNAQDPMSLSGKVLRIRPTPSAARPYEIPSDNPFLDRYRWRPEIWALGVRNPYRMSVDAHRDEVWIGDVGQSCWEELDQLPLAEGGANLEWDRREGPDAFEGGELLGAGTGPAVAVPHGAGWCAVVAGYVPRGDAAGPLVGRLLVTDYCSGVVASLLPEDPEGTMTEHRLDIDLDGAVAIVPGPNGLPWVLSLAGRIWELQPRA